MRGGKFDEELARMSAIVDYLKPRSLILFNESFASTNPREGSEIASDMVRGLLEAQIKVIYVTHLFDLAYGFYLRDPGRALFLRAERLPDGQRTFRLLEGVPLLTSHGEDLYRAIFSTPDDQKEMQTDEAL
jgi:dsDNA-specific endonuclease/ATPase MutS2